MKFSKLSFGILLTAVLSNDVLAGLKLVSITNNKDVGFSTNSLIRIPKGVVYWVKATVINENTPQRLLFYSFTTIGAGSQHSIAPASNYVLNLVSNPNTVGAKQALLVEVSFLDASVRASLLDNQMSKLTKSVKIESPLFIPIEAVSTSIGYVIAGKSGNGLPALVMLGNDLVKQRLIEFSDQKEGGALSLFVAKERLYAVSNSGNTAYLREMTLAGDLLSSTLVPGGGATAVPLANGDGFVISYVNEEGQHFLEKFNEKMKSVWVTKLHKNSGIYNEKHQLLILPKSIAWVGGNDNRLVVYRIDIKNGNILKKSVDIESELKLPTLNGYSSLVDGNNIHIRGVARKNSEATESVFHFVDTP